MHYCHYQEGYHGNINTGLPNLPKLDYFATLPWELRLDILKKALGTNIPKSLAILEGISREWRDYVLSTLWPEFLKQQFSIQEMCNAMQILNALGKESTLKNIYRLLSTNFITTTLSPTQADAFSQFIIPKKQFFLYVRNTGINPIGFSSPGIQNRGVVNPGQSYLSPLQNTTNTNYQLWLYCPGTRGCQGIGIIAESDIYQLF